MQENRSFDEYFGTFPGATGFSDAAAASIFSQPGFPGATSGLTPYRMSTFTASGLQRPGHAHDWVSMHAYWNHQQMNGWSQEPEAAQAGVCPTATVMGYYAADDIPYHWALASSFVLCDHYFGSALAATAPNRLYLMSGCIQDPNPITPLPPGQWPGPAIGNPANNATPANPDPRYQNPDPPFANVFLSWQTYADMLDKKN